jgi:hypothetical protein
MVFTEERSITGFSLVELVIKASKVSIKITKNRRTDYPVRRSRNRHGY